MESFAGSTGIGATGRVNIGLPRRMFLTFGLSVEHLRFQREARVDIETGTVSQPVITPIGSQYGSMYGATFIRDAGGRIIASPVPVGVSDNAGTTRITYLQLPIMVGKSFFSEKVSLAGGLILQAALAGSVYVDRYNVLTGMFTGGMERSRNFTQLSAGTEINVRCMLTKKIGLDISAQHQFTRIYKDQIDSEEGAKLNSISAGLSYVFSAKRQLSINGDIKPFGSGL